MENDQAFDARLELATIESPLDRWLARNRERLDAKRKEKNRRARLRATLNLKGVCNEN